MNAQQDIATFICTEFAPDLVPGELPSDLDLIDSGIIDSLGVLKLVAYLENELDLTIASEELEADFYRSLDDIGALIAKKRDAVAA